MDKNEIVLYQPNNAVAIQVRLEKEDVWLTQQQIADLFGTKRQAITKHLKNIFDSGELSADSVSSILELTAKDGKTYQTKFYNLDAILSVGYGLWTIKEEAKNGKTNFTVFQETLDQELYNSTKEELQKLDIGDIEKVVP